MRLLGWGVGTQDPPLVAVGHDVFEVLLAFEEGLEVPSGRLRARLDAPQGRIEVRAPEAGVHHRGVLDGREVPVPCCELFVVFDEGLLLCACHLHADARLWPAPREPMLLEVLEQLVDMRDV